MNMYTYEENKKVAQTRHGKTAYDKYDVFYHIYLGARKKLNWCCAQFNNDELSLLEFVETSQNIESDVNLFRKQNQKKFIEDTMVELRAMYPYESNTFLKDTAYKMLRDALKKQEKRNASRAKPKRMYFYEDEVELII